MNANLDSIWTPATSVYLKGFWGWNPASWGAIGWTGERGRGRRRNLLQKLTNPFIAVIYVTGHEQEEDDERGMIVGFYLVNHDEGHRNNFMDEDHWNLEPDRWEFSLRALRAFTYSPEHRLAIHDFDPSIRGRAQSVAAMGEIITDPAQIHRLRHIPCEEVPVFATEPRR